MIMSMPEALGSSLNFIWGTEQSSNNAALDSKTANGS